METRAFDELLARSRRAPADVAPRIVAAEYQASIEGERLLQGKASLRIIQSSDGSQLCSVGTLRIGPGQGDLGRRDARGGRDGGLAPMATSRSSFLDPVNSISIGR